MSNGALSNGAGVNGNISGPISLDQSQRHTAASVEINGHSTNGAVLKGSKGQLAGSENVVTNRDATQLAPEIEHITQGYQPLSKLVTRVVQDTFKELLEVIDKMADMESHHTYTPNHFERNPKANGNMNGDSQINIAKKMLLMNFTQKRRAQLIKLLVLAQWSRQSEEVSRLIDLKVWLDKQMALHDECSFWMRDLRRSLEPAKVPNPDLETALKVLSTGTLPSIPDLGYIAAPPLTPQETLKTLRNINILLHIRLNLHEQLPPNFRTFTIKSGRATFVVPEEFEVDLSIAEEDPESQFYFIDFRLLFSPIASELPEGQMRTQLEDDCTKILKANGLPGIYHHLHEFALSMKINILRRQAIEMSRRKWAETLHVEMLRRLLVVQYWVGRPGPKHWIEISVVSGKRTDDQTNIKSESPSYISIRWARDGQRQPGSPPIHLNLQHLSMESILNAIVGLHIKHIFLSTRTKLMETKLYGKSALSLTAKISKVEPADSVLSVQLIPSITSTISIQPMLGTFAIQPSTSLARRAESDLNTLADPAGQAYLRIGNARCLATQEAIESQALALKWDVVRNLGFKQEELRRVFSRDTLRLSYFRKEGWAKHWIMAVSIGMREEEWAILEIDESTPNPTILDIQPISTSCASSKARPIDALLLSSISIAAAGICSQYANVRALRNVNIPYRLCAQPPPRASHKSPYMRFPSLLIDFYNLMKLRRSPGDKHSTWASELIAISYQGLSPHNGQSVLIAEARLLDVKAFAGMPTTDLDEDIAFQAQTGAFAVRIHAPVGASIIDKLYERLQRIERLLHFVMVIKRFRLRTTQLSLSHMSFTYASSPPLTAEVTLDSSAPMALTLNENNPHILLIDHFTHLLNSHAKFEQVALLFALTLPLCRAIATITADETNRNLVVLPRSAEELLLKYTKAGTTLNMRLRRRRKEILWFISEDRNAAVEASPTPPELVQIFEGRGKGWIGLGTAIAATIWGVEDVVGKIHHVLKNRVATAQKTIAPAAPAPVSSSTSAATTSPDKKKKIKEPEIVVLD